MKKKKIGINGMIDLTYPAIFAATSLILTIISLAWFGNLYAYYWFILPRGSLPLALFTFLFVLMQILAGGLAGYMFSRKSHCYEKEKNIATLILIFLPFLSMFWWCSLFDGLSAFGSLIFALLLLAGIIMTAAMCFRKFGLTVILSIPLTLWYFHLLRLSFCILVLN